MNPTIEARLCRLERQNRLLRALLLTGLAVALAAVARGERTEPLRIVSEDGKSQMTLAADRLVFRRDGKDKLALVVDDTTTALVGNSPDMHDHFVLSPQAIAFRIEDRDTVSLLSHGEGLNRGVGIYDDTGRPRAHLVLSTKGAPGLIMSGANPTESIALHYDDDDVQRLAFTRGKGKPATELRNGGEWSGCSAMLGDQEATLALSTTGKAEVRLQGKNGKRLTLAP